MGEYMGTSEYNADEELDIDAADLGFTPGPDALAVSPAERAPTWLAASVAVTVALLLGVALAVQPARAVSHGAVNGTAGGTTDEDTADAATVADETPTHGDLFRLPEWHDAAATDTDAKADADRAAVADVR